MNYSPGKGNFGFEIQAFPKTSTTAAYVKGQLVWVLKNGWKFKGTLSSCSLNTSTGVGTTKGSGTLYYWGKVGSGSNWIAATTGASAVTITFMATLPSTKNKAATVGKFGISFTGTKVASLGSTALPSYSMVDINYGNIKMY